MSGMTLHCVCLLDSFLRVERVCLAAGPGHISFGRVRWDMDQVGCVLALWKLVEAAWCRCRGGLAFTSRG